MRTWMLTFILALGATPFMLHGHQHQTNEQHAYKEIHGAELKDWYDQNKTMIVLDARSKPYFEGTLLPGAIWMPYDASADEIANAIPSKDSLVVVYCSSTSCPASKFLAERLVSDGYTHVYKYPEGLKDWMDQGYPTTSKK